MPIIWKGMLIPPNPQGEKKPLTNITQLPSKIPMTEPKAKPKTNVRKDVNSTFGGLGDI
jgi:hypothetical protein